MGLWHCNRNTQVFDWDVLKKYNWKMDLNVVFKYISEYTKKMDIPLSSVELNIFACRGYGLPDTPTTCLNVPTNVLGGSKTPSNIKISPIMVLDEPKEVITFASPVLQKLKYKPKFIYEIRGLWCLTRHAFYEYNEKKRLPFSTRIENEIKSLRKTPFF